MKRPRKTSHEIRELTRELGRVVRELNEWTDFSDLPSKERQKMELLDCIVAHASGLGKLLGAMERYGMTKFYIRFAPGEDNNKAWRIGIDVPKIDRPSKHK